MRANSSHVFKRRRYVCGGALTAEALSVSDANFVNASREERLQSLKWPGGQEQRSALSLGAQQTEHCQQ